MKKSLATPFMCAAIMSVLLMGCNSDTDASTTAEQTSQTVTQAPETQEETKVEETTEMETTVLETTQEETTVTESEEETSSGEKTWEEAKVSGEKEDFEAYFNVDIKSYLKYIDEEGNIEKITYHSSYLDADREAYVYTPYGYDPNNEYPIVYLIHGIGCDGGQWVSMSAGAMFDNLIKEGTLKPFIAVFPSVIPVGGLDPDTLSNTNIQAFVDFVTEFKDDLEPYMFANYGVSKNREDTAICGLSMGGMEALRVGFTYLDKFNYIGSFSAAPTLETELLKTEDYVPELVLLCSGDKDSTVGKNPYNYHVKLSENGVDHIWYQHPGQSHSPTVWNLGLYNFLTRLGGGFV